MPRTVPKGALAPDAKRIASDRALTSWGLKLDDDAIKVGYRRMAKRKTRDSLQFAALPLRKCEDGTSQVMLLTSRETRRWVIPKGWPVKGLRPADVATREAYEEAGLIGRTVGKRPIGTYHYTKRFAKRELLCAVQVFLFDAKEQLEDWPEKNERETGWFDATEAADMVDETGLADIIRCYVTF